MNFIPTIPGNYITLADLGGKEGLYPLIFWKASGGGYDFRVDNCGPTCTVNIPANTTVTIGTPVTVTANTTGTIDRVEFTSGAPAYFTASSPGINNAPNQYQSTITGIKEGVKFLTAKGIIGGVEKCTTPNRLVTIKAQTTSWWQVDGGGVAALGGGVTSLLPAGQFLDASTTTPGIVVSTGTINVGSGDINNTPNKWKVENSPAFSPAFWTNNGYPAIQKRILQSVTPKSVSGTIGLSDITSADLSNGAYYVKSTGDLSINSLTVGTNKVVIITEDGKNVNIDGIITLEPGGFLMILAGGNITVNSNVTKLQGLFVANGTFDTGSSSTTPLEVDGTVATLGGINFRRDIPGNTPAQSFVFRPDLVAAMPKDTLRRHIRWEEVAPKIIN